MTTNKRASKLEFLTYDMNKEDCHKITVRHYRIWEDHSWNLHNRIMYSSFSR